MLSISLIRIRDNRCAQWEINALTKRSLGRIIGRQLVQFEAMQGQAVVPVRLMAMWAAAFQALNTDCAVNIVDTPAEALHLWDTDIAVFFMDACNATKTLAQAETCIKLNMRTIIASGAPEIYRKYTSHADEIEWCSIDIHETAKILDVADTLDVSHLIPAFHATTVGDYCPYFVPVSLANIESGAPRTIDEILAEIRTLRETGILTDDKRLIFDSPFDEATSTHMLLELASQFVTLEISWCAWLPAITDLRIIAQLRRSGLILACLGKTINFNTLMHDSTARDISAKAVSQLKTRGIAVVAEFIVGDTNAQRDMENAQHIIKSGVDVPIVTIYTPVPEMREFTELFESGRILSTDWSRYNGDHIVYQTNCNVLDIERQCAEMQNELNSGFSILARLLTPSIRQIAMWKNSTISAAESTALRVALATSARRNVQYPKKTQLKMLSDVVLVGKY